MTYFMFIRTLSVLTFSTPYGVHYPMPEYTRSFRIYVLHNVLNRKKFTDYYKSNRWIWEVY